MVRLSLAPLQVVVCALTLTALFSTACTRKAADNSNLSLSFGNLEDAKSKAATSARTIQHNVAVIPSPSPVPAAVPAPAAAPAATVDVIILNVTGSGISTPVFKQWQSNHNGGAAPLTLPNSFNLTVPKGSGRLIQALIVLDTADGGNQFLYGDVTKDLNDDNSSASITVNALGNASAGNNTISGRWLDANGNGRTDTISVYYAVPGKPQMLVDNSTEMFGGWFNTFGLVGAALDYRFTSDGAEVFGGPVDLGTSALLPAGVASSRALRVIIPPYFHNNGSPSANLTLQGASADILGFFGPGGGTKAICYYNTSETIQYAWSDPSGETPLVWNPIVAAPGASDIYIDASSGSRGGVGTGTRDSGSLCTLAGSRFVDYLSVNDLQVTSNDEILGFKGPFEFPSGNNGTALTTSVSGTSLTVGWTFLPGVQSTAAMPGIDGIDIFARVEANSSNNNGDNNGDNNDYNTSNGDVNCAGLTGFNFSLLQNQPVTAANQTYSVTINSLSPALVTGYNNNSVTTIACPYMLANGGKQYFTAGAVSRPNGGGGNGGGGPVATSLAIVAPQIPSRNNAPGTAAAMPAQIASHVCTHFQVVGLAGGQPAFFPGGTNMVISSDMPANLMIYQDQQCMNSLTSVSPGGSTLDFYVKDYDSIPTAHTIMVTSTAPLATSVQAFTLSQPGLSSPPFPTLVLRTPSTINAYSCYPMSAETWNYDTSNMNNTVPEALMSFSPMLPTGPVGLQFFTDTSCQTPMSSMLNLNGSSGQSQISLAFRYNGTATSISIAPTNIGAAALMGGNNISVNQPGPAVKLQIMTNNYTSVGACQPVMLALTDGQGNPSPAPANMTVNLNSSGNGSFFLNNMGGICSTPTSTVNIAQGQPGAPQLYYQPATQTSSVVIAASSASPALNGNTTLNVGPAVASQIYVVFPGQMYTGTSVVGTPAPVLGGSLVNVNLYAVEFNGVVDPNFNGFLSQLNVTGASYPAPPSVVFAGGHAQIPLTVYPSGYNSLMITNLSAQYSGSSNLYFGQIGMVVPPSVPISSMANRLTFYGSNFNNLVPGSCQIFMLAPEDSFGSASLMTPNMVTFDSGGLGTFWRDSACASSQVVSSDTLAVSQTSAIYYFKPTTLGSGTITVAASGPLSSPVPISLTINNASSPGAAHSWQILGHSGTTADGRCNPYVIYLSDTGGYSVAGFTVNNLQVSMTPFGNPPGGFWMDPSCTMSPISPAAQLPFPNAGAYSVFASASMYGGTNEGLNISDGTATYTTNSSLQMNSQ